MLNKVIFSFILWFSFVLPLQAENETITNSIGMEFVKIPAGSFMMGTKSPSCPKDDPFTEKNEDKICQKKVSKNEQPRHKVTIEQPFYMGKYEVTQVQWHEVMDNNPSSFKSEKVGERSEKYPVENISWNDVKVFVTKLNKMEKTDKYRLPSEAEWEYAARAGTTTIYFFGDDKAKLGQYAWYEANSEKHTHKVGQKLPNKWGLYDVYGNVWEWVADCYQDNYKGVPTDGSVRKNCSYEGGRYRSLRGGSLSYDPRRLRSADRFRLTPDIRLRSVGFRLVQSF